MKAFENAEWIWSSASAGNDEYAEFFTELTLKDKCTVRISVDGDYVLYLNGEYAATNQYNDYEHYKVYDEIDLSQRIIDGVNRFSILVWHPGLNSSRYACAAAGLLFEITDGEQVLDYSGTHTSARKSLAWQSGRCKRITNQLGFGFAYDAERDDGSFFTGGGFSSAVAVEKRTVMYPRPTHKLVYADRECETRLLVSSGNHYLVDLGRETVGALRMRFRTKEAQSITVSWGEHLTDGCVRRIIGDRDFSVDYRARAGYNDFTSYMLRFGGRYIELHAEEPIELEYLGLLPQYYPIEPLTPRPTDPLDKKIYELSLATLRASMMEHYVDCPWREQALYAYDSRNQMLAGYYAFEGGNAKYAAANLRLLSERILPEGLFPLVSPTSDPRAIPSFNLHYFLAVKEHLEHTGDTETAELLYPRLATVIASFVKNMEDGIVAPFRGDHAWNFYEWIPELMGDLEHGGVEEEADSVLNLLFIMALDSLEFICDRIGKPFEYRGLADTVRREVNARFLDAETGLYSFRRGDGVYTELASALAVFTSTATGACAERIAAAIAEDRLIPCTLSMKCFSYDACLAVSDSYRDFVLADIRHDFSYMLDRGATTAWETLKGEADFDGAGSLCHGWNAMPIVYYHRFGLI